MIDPPPEVYTIISLLGICVNMCLIKPYDKTRVLEANCGISANLLGGKIRLSTTDRIWYAFIFPWIIIRYFLNAQLWFIIANLCWRHHVIMKYTTKCTVIWWLAWGHNIALSCKYINLSSTCNYFFSRTPNYFLLQKIIITTSIRHYM